MFGAGQKNALGRFISLLKAVFSVDENKVFQRNSNDCAIACLAMLLDLKYSPVRAAVMDYFKNTLKKPFCGMTDDDDIEVAKRFGATIISRRVTRRNRRAVIDRLNGVRAILEVPALDGSGATYTLYSGLAISLWTRLVKIVSNIPVVVH